MFFNTSEAILAKLSLVAFALVIVGCEPAKPVNSTSTSTAVATPENDHEHPKTLPDAVKELEDLCATIKAAFAKDDPETAHEPMHEVPHLLELIPELAAESTLDDAAKEEIKTAAKNLFEAFNAVDGQMHGADGKKYSAVSEDIDAALKTIVDKAKG